MRIGHDQQALRRARRHRRPRPRSARAGPCAAGSSAESTGRRSRPANRRVPRSGCRTRRARARSSHRASKARSSRSRQVPVGIRLAERARGREAPDGIERQIDAVRLERASLGQRSSAARRCRAGGSRRRRASRLSAAGLALAGSGGSSRTVACQTVPATRRASDAAHGHEHRQTVAAQTSFLITSLSSLVLDAARRGARRRRACSRRLRGRASAASRAAALARAAARRFDTFVDALAELVAHLLDAALQPTASACCAARAPVNAAKMP